MLETVYNVTIPNTSPTLAYSPYVSNNTTSGGWQSTCPTYVTGPNGQSSWMCDPDSAHVTSSYNANVQLSFEGVGIYLVGNTTNGLGYDITLDGTPFPGNPRPDLGLLYAAVGLEPGPHSIMLTVRRPASSDNPGCVSFKEAVVSAGTGYTGATVQKRVLDDGDPSITYYAPPGGNWTVENGYTQSVGPQSISTSGFHNSYWTNATATIKFQGIGISVFGACYSHSRYAAYAASIDGSSEKSYDGTTNLYSSDGNVKQRAGNCLRYFKTGLNRTQDHELVLRVKDMGRLAVDWVEIYSVEGANVNGTHNQGIDSQSSSKVAILAGAISGAIVLALALLTILICFRRRKHPGPQEILTPLPNWNQSQTQFTSTPFTPTPPLPPLPSPIQMHMNPHAGPVTHMPPWPQPQSPAPTMHHLGGRTTSFASSGAPLISPGLSFTSSYSGGGGGPGWLDSATYNSYNSTGPGAIGTSISRPTTGATRPGTASSQSRPGTGMTRPGTGSSSLGAVPTDLGSMTAVSSYGMSGSGRAGSSNVAVEGGPSTTASSTRVEYGGGGVGSPSPPAYEQVRGAYSVPGAARR